MFIKYFWLLYNFNELGWIGLSEYYNIHLVSLVEKYLDATGSVENVGENKLQSV